MKRNSKILLDEGTLWRNLIQRSEYALRIGALVPMPTKYEYVEERRIRFFVRILSRLEQKDKEGKEQEKQTSLTGKRENPFLPYENNLFVADISKTHVALLNKFNVVEHHLLIVTREFEDQENLLTLTDFEALWVCMTEYNGLGFYNGGEAAGASQPHKHLQMVPLPLSPEGPQVPIEPLLRGARFKNGFGSIPEFPFLHTFVRFDHDVTKSPLGAARYVYELYREMLARVGLSTLNIEGTLKQSAPYCLLITREWMFLVPRIREFFDSISINSLGFAGAFLVRNEQQLHILKKHGPLTVLTNVAMLL